MHAYWHCESFQPRRRQIPSHELGSGPPIRRNGFGCGQRAPRSWTRVPRLASMGRDDNADSWLFRGPHPSSGPTTNRSSDCGEHCLRRICPNGRLGDHGGKSSPAACGPRNTSRIGPAPGDVHASAPPRAGIQPRAGRRLGNNFRDADTGHLASRNSGKTPGARGLHADLTPKNSPRNFPPRLTRTRKV